MRRNIQFMEGSVFGAVAAVPGGVLRVFLHRGRRKELHYGRIRLIKFLIPSKFMLSPLDLRRFFPPPVMATSCSCMVNAQRSRPTLVEYEGEFNLSINPVKFS